MNIKLDKLIYFKLESGSLVSVFMYKCNMFVLLVFILIRSNFEKRKL